MFPNLPPLGSLKVFESAARHSSFKYAATELSLTQGAISYQIKKLEYSVGVSLFERKTRQIVLTREGEHFYTVVRNVLRELEVGVEQIKPATHPRILTISVSTFFATRWLSGRMGEFISQSPEVTIRLQHSVNDPGFAAGDVDLAIRWGDGKWPGYESVLLVDSPMIALCSPALMRGKFAIRSLDDLESQTFLHDQSGNDRWREWLALAGLSDLGDGQGPSITDPNVRVQSAIDGQGLLLGNRLLAPEIDNGLLVEPFPIRIDYLGFYLVYQNSAPSRTVRTKFIDWLLENARQTETG